MKYSETTYEVLWILINLTANNKTDLTMKFYTKLDSNGMLD